MGLPHIALMVPEVPENFTKHIVEGKTVYIDKRIETTEDRIEFVLVKFLMFERIEAKGLKLDFERK